MFRATVPLGAEIASCRRTKNFIDDAVFSKLKKLGIPPSQLVRRRDVPPPRDDRHRRHDCRPTQKSPRSSRITTRTSATS